nr:MBOAT family protein [Lachnospiraceae bacterium]
MLFNSYIFVFLFLPIALLGWYGLNKIGQRKVALVFLTGMSLWFYGYFNATYLLLIIGSIIGNYLLSLILQRLTAYYGKRDRSDVPVRYTVLICGLLLNLGLLFYFKYYDFFIENVNAIFKADHTLRHILLPLGISFFTFQQLSYIVDRSLGRSEHYGLTEYAAFVTIFPQLIAGPIVLHSELIPQFMSDEHRFNADGFYDGMVTFVLGLSKKVLL